MQVICICNIFINMKKMILFLLVTGIAQADEVTDYQLPEISVLGQSSKNSAFDYLPTVSKVSGVKLERKRQSTLGETLHAKRVWLPLFLVRMQVDR